MELLGHSITLANVLRQREFYFFEEAPFTPADRIQLLAAGRTDLLQLSSHTVTAGNRSVLFLLQIEDKY